MKHQFEKLKDIIYKFNVILTSQQKIYGLFVFIATLIGVVLETLGVSAILPVIQSLMNVESLGDKWYLRPFIQLWNIQSNDTLVYIVCGEVIMVYIVKNLYFILYTWITKKYAYKIRRELGTRVINAYMAQGYIFFVNNNTSRLIQGMSGDVGAVIVIINSFFMLLTKILTIFAIGGYIIIQAPGIALVLFGLAVFCVAMIQVMFRNVLKKYSVELRVAEREISKASFEAIQGSKEILAANNQKFFVDKYVKSTNRHIKASIMLDMALQTPTYIIEMVCVTGLLLIIALEVGRGNASVQMIEAMSMVAVAAFRILPGVAAASSAYSTIKSRMPSFQAAYETVKRIKDLEEENQQNKIGKASEMDKETNIVLKDNITFHNVSYRYPNTEKYILKNIEFVIKAKSSVGLIGSSGAGKSTFVDVLLGLLKAESGTITMDGVEIEKLGAQWNRNIGYVPQSVYLLDASVRENIAFGIEKDKINEENIWNALEMAQLKEFVSGLSNGLETQVGERGVKFSGGQMQRLAIARALYFNPEILVLDEATAALDNETEQALMEGIENLLGRKTLIIIAHRLTTIRKCDFIYEISEGTLIPKKKEDVLGKT